MRIESPLSLCAGRSLADGMVVGTSSMKVGWATEAGKAEVSRGAKLAMEIQRLGENKSHAILMYLVAMVAAMLGITYAAVPLYHKFCQATDYGGTIQRREVASCRQWRRKLHATRLKNLQVFGVSTYNVTPMKAGIYFNKIQCFCFEEQWLLPGEKIDTPLFFYIDLEFTTGPKMDNINSSILSYTFFKVEDAPAQIGGS